MAGTKRKIKVTGQYNTHVLNHRVLMTLRHLAERNDDHSFRCKVAEIVFGVFTLEGYANTIIQYLDISVWENERTKFSTEPYKNVIGKIRWMHEQLKLPVLDVSRGLYQRLSKLVYLRNQLAHAKPIKYEGLTSLSLAGNRPKPLGGYFDKKLRGLDPRIIFDDVLEACKVIDQARGKSASWDKDAVFGNVYGCEMYDYRKGTKRFTTITTLEPLCCNMTSTVKK